MPEQGDPWLNDEHDAQSPANVSTHRGPYEEDGTITPPFQTTHSGPTLDQAWDKDMQQPTDNASSSISGPAAAEFQDAEKYVNNVPTFEIGGCDIPDSTF